MGALAGAGGKGAQPPFRESKLTLLLKDALSGHSKTCLIACVSPSLFNLEETIGTLEFASRCKLIKTNAKKNEQAKGDLIAALTQEKAAIEAQWKQEMEERRKLQEQLEQELSHARAGNEEAEKWRAEKEEIERR